MRLGCSLLLVGFSPLQNIAHIDMDMFRLIIHVLRAQVKTSKGGGGFSIVHHSHHGCGAGRPPQRPHPALKSTQPEVIRAIMSDDSPMNHNPR